MEDIDRGVLIIVSLAIVNSFDFVIDRAQLPFSGDGIDLPSGTVSNTVGPCEWWTVDFTRSCLMGNSIRCFAGIVSIRDCSLSCPALHGSDRLYGAVKKS